MDERRSGLHYRAWRKPLRGGLYAYRSSAVLAGVSPGQLRAFHLDDEIRWVGPWGPWARQGLTWAVVFYGWCCFMFSCPRPTSAWELDGLLGSWNEAGAIPSARGCPSLGGLCDAGASSAVVRKKRKAPHTLLPASSCPSPRRPRWDDTVLDIQRVAPPSLAAGTGSAAGAAGSGGSGAGAGTAPPPPPNSEWCMHRFRSRFPRPMVRRAWAWV